MKTFVASLAAIGFAVVSTVALAQDCEEGMIWDEGSESCVPSD